MDSTKIKYPIGIQSFDKIRTGNYAYVDKTALVYKLANEHDYVFLSRPRRFGKSLLLSTLQAYFEGRSNLFKGLAIEKLETEWLSYPVIFLSLSGYNPNQEGNLEAVLNTNFKKYEQEYNIQEIEQDFYSRFHDIILAAYKNTGQKVVILIDEYDAPLVAHLDEIEKQEEMRNLLKSIYANLKDMDQYIKFGMLTGVSRFSKVTIFSGINNLKDISMLPQYSEICGITEQELKDNFKIGIELLANSLECNSESAVAALKENYDGYHFTRKSVDIFNPFSLINALSDSHISAFWFSSGTPTFLIKQIQRNPGLLNETFNADADE